MCGGDRYHRHIVQVLAEGFATLAEYADHPKASVVDPHPLTERGPVTEKLPAQTRAEHDDIGGAFRVDQRKGTATAELEVSDWKKIGGRADHRDLAFTTAA